MSSEGSHYFDAQPAVGSNRQKIELSLADVFLELHTDSGVFSAGRVDPGTRYLLQEMPPVPDETTSVLDLGCGYGPIALTMARRARAAVVLGVDVNERALDLARENARTNGIDTAKFVTAAEVPSDQRFDLIVSNPPIRIGKQALHGLLAEWIPRLSPGGRAWMVVQKHLGSDSLASWMTDQGWPTTRLSSRKGYRILETTVGTA